MKRFTTTLFVSALALTLAIPAFAAFPLRVPQVTLGSGSLQGYLNGVGESIMVGTDQLDAQSWSTSISGNSTLTLMIELAGFAPNNALGVYNTSDPSPTPMLFQVFPGAATTGWYATAHFGASGSLVVSLFDDNAVYQGQSAYAGVDKNAFGFYIQGPGGTFYSQDSRNGGTANVLTFAGTGTNYGNWWQCFDDLPYGGGDHDFDDAILFVESITPVPTQNTSFGRIKMLYR